METITENSEHEPKVKNWLRLLEKGIIKAKTIRLLHFIKTHANTDLDEIRNQLNMAHQTASAILSNVMDEGLVYSKGERTVHGREYSVLIFVENEEMREHLKQARAKAKYIQWLHRGITDHANFLTPALSAEIKRVMPEIPEPEPQPKMDDGGNPILF